MSEVKRQSFHETQDNRLNDQATSSRQARAQAQARLGHRVMTTPAILANIGKHGHLKTHARMTMLDRASYLGLTNSVFRRKLSDQPMIQHNTKFVDRCRGDASIRFHYYSAKPPFLIDPVTRLVSKPLGTTRRCNPEMLVDMSVARLRELLQILKNVRYAMPYTKVKNAFVGMTLVLPNEDLRWPVHSMTRACTELLHVHTATMDEKKQYAPNAILGSESRRTRIARVRENLQEDHRYRPGGQGFLNAAAHFNSLQKQKN